MTRHAPTSSGLPVRYCKRIVYTINQLKGLTMYSLFGRRVRRALFDIIGALAIVGAGVLLMLAYFDVLTH